MINIKDCWKDAKKEHTEYFNKEVNKNISNSILNKEIKKFLSDNLEKIRDGESSDFKKIQKDFESLPSYKNKENLKKIDIKKKLSRIFDYSTFSNKHSKEWNAYSLCQKGKYSICPYCNLSYAKTLIIDGKGAFRPSLDHFFDKARYPLFSLSLGNLIPSCHICNSSLKTTKDFIKNEHIHPFETDEIIKFKISPDKYALEILDDIEKLQHLSISIEIENLKGNESRIAKNSIKTFFLNERYNLHIDEIREILEPLFLWRHEPNLEHFKEIKKWNLGKIKNEKYKNKLMGKITKDIFEKIEI